MRLQSDIDALAAIEEDAQMMLKRLRIPDDKQKLEVVVCLRQIIELAAYRKAIDDLQSLQRYR
ncbi:hypothetical protein EPZ47_18820 [Pseudomonas viciae]|uniref:Uncharacterized protein n=1 Tax=Pseudomonas viciae TaxID=2505979 RepID=A0A4P7PIQ4_9PSED|nr:hypothetical protein [Pseudomonas viciae]QBZ90680.1 hypothetical protein EPZ47_18820 [Pseudomonas viciae]